MKTLMTYTLLNCWLYMFDAPEGTEEDAEKEFIDALKRKPKKENKAIIHGLEFENDCYRFAEGLPVEHKRWKSAAEHIGSMLKDSLIQVRVEADLKLDGNDFVLYGIADGLKAGTLTDVKWTETSLASKDVTGKYRHSPQHPMYFFLAPDADQFQYLLSDGRDVYEEKYRREETESIITIIQQFINYLDKERLIDIYRKEWAAKYE